MAGVVAVVAALGFYLVFPFALSVRAPHRRVRVLTWTCSADCCTDFSVALQPANLFWCFVGCFLGTVVGILPGLGPAATIALLLPLTFKMDPAGGIIMLAGIYYGAKYGGSTTSILLNIPGESSSVVTCIDGHAMAKNGRAGPALGIAAIASFVAGTVGILLLTVMAPPVALFALQFSSPEYFALMCLGLALVVLLSGPSLIKGLMALFLGLWLTSIGTDLFSAQARFIFGQSGIARRHGFRRGRDRRVRHRRGACQHRRRRQGAHAAGAEGHAQSPAELGRAQGLPLRLHQRLDHRFHHRHPAGRRRRDLVVHRLRHREGVLETSGEVRTRARRKASPRRKAPTMPTPAARWCRCSRSAFPGGGTTAIMLSALVLWGVRPGPLLMTESPDIFWGLVASMYIGNVVLLILNLPLVPVFAQILRLPVHVLFPIILGISLVGAYGVSGRLFDIGLLVGFGLLGYIMVKLKYPTAPLILGFVLGDAMERALRQSLTMSQGDLSILVRGWISATMLAGAVLILLLPLLGRFNKARVQAIAEGG